MSLLAGLTVSSFFTRSSPDPFPLVVVGVSTWWYLRSARIAANSGRGWSRWRVAAWVAGELCLLAGASSGMVAFDGRDFTDQAVQYSLVGMVAPLLLALGAPLSLALRTSGHRGRTFVAILTEGKVGRLLSHPAFTWPVFAGPLFGLYLSGWVVAASQHAWLDQLTYLVLVSSGLLFCLPAVGADPLGAPRSVWWRVAYGLLTLPLFAVLGMALESAGSSPAGSISLGSLHVGGGVTWIMGNTLAIAGCIGIFVQWLRADERAARAYDQQAEMAAQEQLAHWRSVRDAALRAGEEHLRRTGS